MSPKSADADNAIVRMFQWWNDAFGDAGGFSPAAFRAHYTEDAELVVNGNLRGRGPTELAQHYRTLQGRFEVIRMVLPVTDSFACGDRAFVHCVTEATKDGVVTREVAMAAATLRDGLISSLNVIGYSEE